MKQIKGLLSLATIIGMIVVSGCTKDVYDSSKTPDTTPTDNPLGEGFSAPSDFSWSMVNTVNLNVEVKDEFSGQYGYLIEVFTTNPLSDASATPIAAGVAQQSTGYIYNTAEIDATTVERLFIRQTDPKQRKEVYEYAVPENGGALSCKLYYTGSSSTKALSTRAFTGSTSAYDAARANGVIELADQSYTDVAPTIPTVPSQSDAPVNQYNPNTYANGAKILIPSGTTSTTQYQMQSGVGTIFVKGTWETNNLYSNFNIYVLNGGKLIVNGITVASVGKLIVEEGGTLECKNTVGFKNIECYVGGTLSGNSVTFESTANLTIGPNGSVITSGTFAPCGVTKNFGTITANQISCNQGTPSIFNAGTITTAGEFFINRTNFINHGTATAGTWLRMNSTNQVLNKGTISATNINNTSSTIANYGDFLFNETSGQFTFNNSHNAVIINHDGGTIKGYDWNGGLSFYNDGFIEVYKYNSCTLIIKNKFVFANVTLDKGSITGGKPDDINATNDASLWKPVPLLETSNPVTFILKNGSMIKATKLLIKNSPNLFDGQSGDISGMQVDNITLDGAAGGNTTFNGNLVFSNPTITNNAHGNIITQNGVSMVGSFDESKYTIATCGGYYAPGNPGNPTPSDPTFPITIGDATNYTYAFEDRWPSYGDFDLNDIVLSLKDKSAEIYGNGSLKSVQFQISLDAVGASKMLGVGIRFLSLPANTNLKTFTVNGNDVSFESGQSMPTLILFSDAHKEFGFTDSRPFINTYQNSSTNKASKTYNVVLTFNSGSTVPSSVFNVANLDMFIITEAATTSTKRTEVHIAGYAPTDLANTSMFKAGNDDSSTGHYYLSNENLAWGIIIPGDFAWPLETKKVTDVYSLFKSWVSSGGAENREWYTTHNNEVYTNQ